MSRGKPEDNHRAVEVEEFIRLVIAGESVAAIAKKMKMTTRSCYAWRRRPRIHERICEALGRLREAEESHIVAARSKGRRMLVKLLKSRDEKTQLAAAKALAEMSNITPAGTATSFTPPVVDETAEELLASADAFFRRQGIELVRTSPAPASNGHSNGHTFPTNGKTLD